MLFKMGPPKWVVKSVALFPAFSLAVVCSFSFYFVPVSQGLPLGSMAFAVAMHENVWAFLYVVGWQAIVCGAWLLFWSTSRSIRYLRVAPVVFLLTIAPAAFWGAFDGVTRMTPEKVAGLRPPETGDWEETCRLDGYDISTENSRTALEQGQAWVYRRRGEEIHEYFLFSPDACEATAASWVPYTELVDGGPEGRALWTADRQLFFSSPEQRDPLRLEPSRAIDEDRAVLSFDGSWAAWTQPLTPNAIAWEFAVQRTTVGTAQVISLNLPLEGSYSVDPLAYDPVREELRLRADTYLGTVDRGGNLMGTLFRPDGCDEKLLGHFRLHPRGWIFSGSAREDCDLVWSLGPYTGRFEGDRYSGELGDYSSPGLPQLALNHTATLLGGETGRFLGHHSWVHDSVLVIRLSDGAEVFRRHLAVFEGEAVAVFLGDQYFAFSDSGKIRVFRLPDDLR